MKLLCLSVDSGKKFLFRFVFSSQYFLVFYSMKNLIYFQTPVGLCLICLMVRTKIFKLLWIGKQTTVILKVLVDYTFFQNKNNIFRMQISFCLRKKRKNFDCSFNTSLSRMSGDVAQLVERRLVMERLLVQCSNRGFVVVCLEKNT